MERPVWTVGQLICASARRLLAVSNERLVALPNRIAGREGEDQGGDQDTKRYAIHRSTKPVLHCRHLLWGFSLRCGELLQDLACLLLEEDLKLEFEVMNLLPGSVL